MCTLLLVEDDLDLAEAIQIFLSAEGFEVISTGSARQAIDVAARLRPELMLIDWMLRDGVDGIRIIEAMRAIECMPKTIMMTGLVCDDLLVDAREMGVIDVVTKPVANEKLFDVLEAARKKEKPISAGSFSVLEVGPAGELLHVNNRATQMFARASLHHKAPRCIADLFATEVLPDLQAAENRWVAAPPSGRSPVNWHIRAQSPRVTGSRLLIVLEANEPHYRQQELIRLILGYKPAAPAIEGRVLIVDPSESWRRLAHSMLTSAGVGCCTAENQSRALRLMEQDPGIRVVIVDLDGLAEGVARFVDEARQRRDGLTFVGAVAKAGEDHSAWGVHLALTKPWTLTALTEALEV